MGLEFVEIIMEIEDEFEITIPDNYDWNPPITVRTIVLLVQHILDEKNKPCATAASYRAFRRALIAKTSIKKRETHPSACLQSLIPRFGRKELWSDLQKHMLQECYLLPNLTWTKPGVRIAASFCLLISIAGIFLAFSTAFIPVLPFIALVIPFVSIFLTKLLFSPVFQIVFPYNATTVADISKKIHHFPLSKNLKETIYASQELEPKIKKIIAKNLDIPESKISLDNRLYEDLGM